MRKLALLLFLTLPLAAQVTVLQVGDATTPTCASTVLSSTAPAASYTGFLSEAATS